MLQVTMGRGKKEGGGKGVGREQSSDVSMLECIREAMI